LTTPLDALQTLTFMSVVVEFLTAIFRHFVSKRATEVVSIAVGVVLCCAYEVGIFMSLGLMTKYPYIDYIISGIIISRGSNALSELFKLRQK
jgi:large-conductance mechanosensitive channel